MRAQEQAMGPTGAVGPICPALPRPTRRRGTPTLMRRPPAHTLLWGRLTNPAKETTLDAALRTTIRLKSRSICLRPAKYRTNTHVAPP